MRTSIEQKKEPHFISPRLLEALGGVMDDAGGKPLVDKGAYLWGVEDREKGKGLFNHVLLVSRVSNALAQELKKKAPEQYGSLNMRSVFEVALLHDVSKLYAQDRESLSANEKEGLGLRSDFKETDDETEQTGADWLKRLGFPEEVLEGVKDHFPQDIKDDPYWKIGLVADYMTGQKVMTLAERLDDVKRRWIDERAAQGVPPRIDPAVFERSRANIEAVAREVFGALETTDEEFIASHKLNDPKSATRSERFLRRTYEQKREARAKGLVRARIGDSR